MCGFETVNSCMPHEISPDVVQIDLSTAIVIDAVGNYGSADFGTDLAICGSVGQLFGLN